MPWVFVLLLELIHDNAPTHLTSLALSPKSWITGPPWLPPRMTRKLLAHLKPRSCGGPGEPLTSREAGVLNLLAKGRSNQQIAQELNIAEATVRTHVSHILDKLGVSNRVEAALHALRAGVATLEG